MDPLMITGLAKLGVKLGMNLLELLKGEGVEFSDEDLRAYRAASQAEVDRFNALVGEE